MAALLMPQQMVLPAPHHSQWAVVTDPVKLSPVLATVTSGVKPSKCLFLMCFLHTGMLGASCCVSLQDGKVSDWERGNDRINRRLFYGGEILFPSKYTEVNYLDCIQ